MHQSITYLLVIITLFLFSGCSEPNPSTSDTYVVSDVKAELQTPETDKRTAVETVASAKKLQQEALRLGHAWRTTSDFINKAEKLINSGDANSARSAALRAELSANASIAQAHSEQSAWQDRFPK